MTGASELPSPFLAQQLGFLREQGGRGLLLFRHAKRELIEEGMSLADAHNLQLTPQGRVDAVELGRLLAAEFPSTKIPLALSSPVQRCQDTLSLVLQGLGQSPPIRTEPILVLSGLLDNIKSLPSEKDIFKAMASGRIPFGPESKLDSADAVLACLLRPLEEDSSAAGLVLAASHDIVLALLLMRCFGERDVLGEKWPGLLETMLLVRLDHGRYAAHWRGRRAEFTLALHA